MQVVVRVDSSVLMGSGHVMRCLALAAALRTAGATVEFVCSELPGNLINVIEGAGFAVARLDPGPDAFKVAANDAESTIRILRARRDVRWMVVDHYGIGAEWERAVRPYVHKIFVIDDLADRAHDCDVLLDQNELTASEKYKELVGERCRILLGPNYALLRPEFREWRQRSKTRTEVRRILVFFGGSDVTGETLKTLRVLSRFSNNQYAIDVVVGASNPRIEQIRALCSVTPNVTLLCQVQNMAELMASCDLAIGGGGTSMWERSAVGLPAIVMAVAENQVPGSVAMGQAGNILYLGEAASTDEASLQAAIHTLTTSVTLLTGMSKSCFELVDGRGAERVARVLTERSLCLRLAAPGDSKLVYDWRNSEEIRNVSGNSEPIAFEGHQRWFDRVLADPNRVLLIAEQSNVPVGVLRYDIENGVATVSAYLAPEKIGGGIGRVLFAVGSEWLMANRPEVSTITAEIMEGNEASRKALTAAGYQPHKRELRKTLSAKGVGSCSR